MVTLIKLIVKILKVIASVIKVSDGLNELISKLEEQANGSEE